MTSAEFRAALERLELSQHGFAAYLHVAPSSVSRWARGGTVPHYAYLALSLLWRDRRVEPAPVAPVEPQPAAPGLAIDAALMDRLFADKK